MTGKKATGIALEEYEMLYQESLENSGRFWSKQANTFLHWSRPFDRAIEKSKETGLTSWFPGGELNIAYNCIDRHVESGHGDQVAYFWEGNNGDSIEITYSRLQDEVSRFANALVAKGVKKGDRVCIYMPMIPEAIYAMLAVSRIGAVHTVVFAGFSSEALKTRIEDCGAKVLVTADTVQRGEKVVDLTDRIEAVVDLLDLVVLVSDSVPESLSEAPVALYSTFVGEMSISHTPVPMQSTDPLFILYTSGSTGKPKGVLHTIGGYLLYAAITHKYAFDYREGDVYWCAADVGWITGHSYIVYGPLANRATSVMYEGVPMYPTASRTWEIVDKYAVTLFYSTPTALRALMSFGDEAVVSTSRKSLRVLGTVGEPINPEVWQWYHDVVGNGSCHIVDTWWQTETGGHAILSFVRDVAPKPGSAMYPFFGIKPMLLDGDKQEIMGKGEGALVLKGDWPGKLSGLYNNQTRFKETYLDPYPGYYCTGDGAARDSDGHYWITGRVDDTLNVSGRLIGTAEVESALVAHEHISEAAVVDKPHDIKGSQVVAFVVPMKEHDLAEDIVGVLKLLVKEEIGSFAKPDVIILVDDLPKTRSGKIMRRVLRKMLVGEFDNLGDISTLADVDVLPMLQEKVQTIE